jgi:hypothetical protein
LYGLSLNGFNLHGGCPKHDQGAIGVHNQGRLPDTDLPNRGQTLASGFFDLELNGDKNWATSFQGVRLHPQSKQDNQQLANLILQRVKTRLPGRIRNLAVLITDDSVELTGKCRTYYAKQMAQHVAMGVLDYQQLVNSISVC